MKYLGINAAAAELGVHESSLRRWEEWDLIFPDRVDMGNIRVRIYDSVNPHPLKICDRSRKRIRLMSFESWVPDKGTLSLEFFIPMPPDMTGKNQKLWNLAEAKSWIPAHIVGGRTRKGVIWVLTTLGRDQLDDEGVLQLYRLEWQIELLFKRLKGLAHEKTPSEHGMIFFGN